MLLQYSVQNWRINVLSIFRTEMKNIYVFPKFP
jgi:hypothetical protein